MIDGVRRLREVREENIVYSMLCVYEYIYMRVQHYVYIRYMINVWRLSGVTGQSQQM